MGRLIHGLYFAPFSATWGGQLVSIKNAGAVALVFCVSFYYIDHLRIKSNLNKPATKNELSIELTSKDSEVAPIQRSVANVEESRMTSPTADSFNNWKDTKKFLKARSIYLTMPSKTAVEFHAELMEFFNSYPGTYFDKDLCNLGYAMACLTYTTGEGFFTLPNGDRQKFNIKHPPDEEFSAAATFACVEGLWTCDYAFLNIRGSEQAEQLEKILNFQCDQGLGTACEAIENEIAGKLDFKTHCKDAKSCPYLFTESFDDILNEVIQKAKRNCDHDSFSSCERLLHLLPKDSPEVQNAIDNLHRMCANDPTNGCYLTN